MKLKAIIASLVVLITVWGANASAALTTTSTTNLAFVLLNDSNDTSWVVDTGQSLLGVQNGSISTFSVDVLGAINTAVSAGLTDLTGYTWSVVGGSLDATLVGSIGSYNSSVPDGVDPGTISQQIGALDRFLTENQSGSGVSQKGSTDAGFWSATGNGWAGNFDGLSGALLAGVVGVDASLDALGNFIVGGGAFDGGIFTLSSSGLLEYNPTVIPLPAAVWMLGSALVGLLGFGRRRRSEASA